MKKKILIVGASGFLGSTFLSIFKKNYNVLGTYCKNKPKSNKIKFIKLENNHKSFKKKIKEFSPNIIIHCAGITDIEYCEKNKKNCKKVNIELTKFICELANVNKSKLVYISSDHLFDGKNKSYSEKYKTSPLNYYGISKVISEKIIDDKLKDFLIIRTNFFGSLRNKFKKNFLYFILKNLIQRRKIYLFKDVYYSPISISELTRCLIKLINFKQVGIFNISGNERISKYKFGILVARIFNLNEKLVIPIKINEKKLVSRPLNMALSNKKLKKIGIKVKSLNTQLKKI